MNRVSLKQYTLHSLQYDIMLLDSECDNVNFKTTVHTTVSTKNHDDNIMQIDMAAYSMANSPFLKLSILGKFGINEKDDNVDDYGTLLREEGFLLLYDKLRDILANIAKETNTPFKRLPDLRLSDFQSETV